MAQEKPSWNGYEELVAVEMLHIAEDAKLLYYKYFWCSFDMVSSWLKFHSWANLCHSSNGGAVLVTRKW